MNEEQRVNLRNYKYAGGDQGYLYVYFYNPVAKTIVEYLPETLAPNVVTLIGFIFSTLPFIILFGNYGTKFENDSVKIPHWFFFFYAFCYFMYRMFDELDGKQARRTGNSSPLGLLFDHGCDAFSMGFQCMVVAKCLQCGDNIWVVLTVMIACASFHFSTLEEYYTGGLFLGPGNGISDGSGGVIGLFIFMGFFGNDFWKFKAVGSFEIVDLAIVGIMIGNIGINFLW